jgi:hypothetical protein
LNLELRFEGRSKGIEGAISVHDLNNELVILALCEANYCLLERKSEAGNGRIVAMYRQEFEDGTCEWSTIREIHIPKSANFRDYSAITMDPNGRVAIASQEDSRLWVGHLLGQEEGGLWDVYSIEFDWEVGKVYDFPRNDRCEKIYCKIEGVHWLDDKMIIAVLDKMKKGKERRIRNAWQRTRVPTFSFYHRPHAMRNNNKWIFPYVVLIKEDSASSFLGAFLACIRTFSF